MGKPYVKDLNNLVSTIRWAESVDISDLAAAVGRRGSLPLLAIGSGGSQSVASFTALMHRRLTGGAAEETTPLLSVRPDLRRFAVQIFTASGANPDVLGCFMNLIAAEPENFLILSSAASSPLREQARAYWYAEYFGYEGPFQGEGFVATNSILAQAILMKRAYEVVYEYPSQSVSAALESPETADWLASLETTLTKIGPKRHLVVLFDQFGKPAAVDLESKFSEVGLASVQLADFRNFAHGRHNWLDKQGKDTLVISIETSAESALASRTLRLFPADVPALRITVREGEYAGSIMAMFAVMKLTGIFGSLRSLDPGRPGVPGYGSRLYRLNAWSGSKSRLSIREIAIARKSRKTVPELRQSLAEFEKWQGYFDSFMTAIGAMHFDALALDYDGTLCDQRERYSGVGLPIQSALNSLLDRKVPVLVVTGRGRSVGQVLRQAVSRNRWHLVRVAYYNGAEIHPLSYDRELHGKQDPPTELAAIAEQLRAHPLLSGHTVEIRRSQISVSASVRFPPRDLHAILADLLVTHIGCEVKAVTSTHSVDILLHAISKRNALHTEISRSFLCIGDSGEWPGNDYELLREPGSLSSDRTSQHLDSCWHISPVGSRNCQSTLHYLSCLITAQERFYIDTRQLLADPR